MNGKNELVETDVSEKKVSTDKKKSTTKSVQASLREVADNVSDFIEDIELGDEKTKFALRTGVAFTKAAMDYAFKAQDQLDKLKAQRGQNDKVIIETLQMRLDTARLMLNERDLPFEKKEKYYDEITAITTEIVVRLDANNETINNEIVSKEKVKDNAVVTAWAVGGLTIGAVVVLLIQGIAKSIKKD